MFVQILEQDKRSKLGSNKSNELQFETEVVHVCGNIKITKLKEHIFFRNRKSLETKFGNKVN